MAQPPEETFPERDVVDFLREINDSLAHEAHNRDAFFALFTDIGKHEIVDVDIEHILPAVEPLLQDHPRLLDRFSGLVDPVRQGLQFLKRVEKALSQANYDRFVAKLYSVEEEQSLDAHRVYKEFKELFDEEHEDLLRGLAEFLPRKYDPPKAGLEDHRPPGHKHSFAGADASESSRPSWAKKKPRVVVDVGPAPEPVCFADTGAAGSSRARRPHQYDSEYAYDDGSWPEHKHIPCAVSVADGRKSSRPSRARKSCADDSKSHRHATVGGAVGGSVHAAAAAAPDANDIEVRRRFREAWEFETGYSMLDATLKRATELRQKGERERLNGASASLDELFPKLESQGYLARMYGKKWNHMRELLEHGGDHTASALKVIVHRLAMKDAEAVDEARRRQDPSRAAQRLQELAQERVRLEHGKMRDQRQRGLS